MRWIAASSAIQGRDRLGDPAGGTHDQIGAAYARLAGGGLVAVRSSAVSEDGAAASFAGQQETYLNVRGIDDVLRRVQRVLGIVLFAAGFVLSLPEGRADDTRMAVVVQEMVQADKSGVMFTVDPIRSRYDFMVVEGAAGLGEAIVSGEITPDHYVVSREDGSIENQFIPGDAAAVLTLDELDRLRMLGLQLERFLARLRTSNGAFAGTSYCWCRAGRSRRWPTGDHDTPAHRSGPAVGGRELPVEPHASGQIARMARSDRAWFDGCCASCHAHTRHGAGLWRAGRRFPSC